MSLYVSGSAPCPLEYRRLAPFPAKQKPGVAGAWAATAAAAPAECDNPGMHGAGDPDTAPQWYWDRYWQADRLAACHGESVTGNYAVAIRGAWERFFAACPDGARLLDIGTGNGAVAIIASQTAARNARHFDIHGVDRADIDPARYVRSNPATLAGIRFHARTSAEALPFPDTYFDVITGQYALEYTDLQHSLMELRRVAKPGARLRFVLHARGARPVNAAVAGLDDIAHVTDTLTLLDKARAMMRTAFAFEHTQQHDARLEAEAHAAVEVYRAAARAAEARRARSTEKAMFEDIFANVFYCWEQRHKFTLEHILAGLEAVDTEIRAHRARLENMCAVALTRAGAEQLSERLRAAGFETPVLAEFPTPNSQEFMGWELRARQPA